MRLYVAIWEDRHTDTTAHLFSDKDKAIEWARDVAEENCHFPEDYSEENCPKEWIFNVVYSCENDNIRVVECEVDSDLEK